MAQNQGVPVDKVAKSGEKDFQALESSGQSLGFKSIQIHLFAHNRDPYSDTTEKD